MSFYPCPEGDCTGTMKPFGKDKYEMFKCSRCGFSTREENLRKKVVR